MNSDQPHIEQIRVEYAWSMRHRVMYPDRPFEYVQLPQDHEGLHYGVFVDKQVVTVASLYLQEHQRAQFRKVATEPLYQNRGYATLLLRYIFEQAETYERSLIWCNARAQKIGFYERLGMYPTDQQFHKDGIDFVIMEKMLSVSPVS